MNLVFYNSKSYRDCLIQDMFYLLTKQELVSTSLQEKVGQSFWNFSKLITNKKIPVFTFSTPFH